jgi:glycerol transport system ATP-binding protein
VAGLSRDQRALLRRHYLGFIFQGYNLLPRTSALHNVELPLIYKGLRGAERRSLALAALEKVGLADRYHHDPSELSGGQQQRTAIARALVKDAQLLLLDEPLVNLDYKLREELREELQEIFDKRQSMVVYTTTEPGEALMLGGNIVVLDEGRILQTGPTAEVYHNPATIRAAEVFSDPPINFLDGSVQDGAARLGRDIRLPLSGLLGKLSSGAYRFGVRSNHLFLNRSFDDDIEFHATVELSEINGSETFVHVNHGGTPLVVQEVGIHTRKIGSKIVLYVNPANIFVYDEHGCLVASPGRGEAHRAYCTSA